MLCVPSTIQDRLHQSNSTKIEGRQNIFLCEFSLIANENVINKENQRWEKQDETIDGEKIISSHTALQMPPETFAFLFDPTVMEQRQQNYI